jgi:DNA-binding CsgD family transcriptional regulator
MSPEQLARLLANEKHSSPLDALNERELEVFSLIGQGYTAGQMDSEFGIAPPRLKATKLAIQKKLGLKNEVQLLQFAARQRRQGAA